MIVTTVGGAGTGSGLYTYVAAPTVTAVSPSSGPTAGGTTVTITGTNLSNASAVLFGTSNAASYAVNSATQITASSPSGTSSTVDITVVTAGGASATSSADHFTWGNPANCGTAAGQPSAFAPTSNLCSWGTASTPSLSNHQWNWSCSSNVGSPASCSVATQLTVPPIGSGGNGSVQLGSSSGWVVDPSSPGFVSAASINATPALPQNVVFPQGLLQFTLTSGTGPAQLTISYPNPLPPGTRYWKYGPSPSGYNCDADCAAPHWYTMPANQAVFSDDMTSVTLTINDGGVGDDDLAVNQVIVDAGGAGVSTSTAGIPVLSDWMRAVLAFVLAGVGVLVLRRRSMCT